MNNIRFLRNAGWYCLAISLVTLIFTMTINGRGVIVPAVFIVLANVYFTGALVIESVLNGRN